MSTLERVAEFTMCGAENVRDTVETCTPEALATSRIVTVTVAHPNATACRTHEYDESACRTPMTQKSLGTPS
ncbi:hypothetical protein GCM10009850_013620 [Nonomuraea monospora]|uniref:Uncharacterized protein n=1 Tax=Nonomuraea monospora TaxID=568818 RepID=A0ABP5P273_9ACTN